MHKLCRSDPHYVKLPSPNTDDAGFAILTGTKLFQNPPLLMCSEDPRINPCSAAVPMWVEILPTS